MADTPAGSVADVVDAGTAWLDARDPDWWRADTNPAINLDKLSMRSPVHCVLGQRYGDYSDVPIGPAESALLGFDATGGRGVLLAVEYAQLGAEWRRVISARRAEAVTTGA